MISLRGLKFNVVALLVAAVCLAGGVYFTFFHSRGFVRNTATIVAVREEETEDSTVYYPTVEHTVDGVVYTGELDVGSGSYKVGKSIQILYDPNDPSVVHSSGAIGVYLMCVSAAIIAFVLFSEFKDKKGQKELQELRESRGQTGYLPSVQGEERELYFLSDLGTAKVGHRIEDADRRVLYEAKMTRLTALSAYRFDFIDHTRGTSTPHLVGHAEETDWNSFFIDNHYTFEFDGVDVFKHLHQNGVRVETSLESGNGRLLGTGYRIFRDGVEIARAESTGQYPHEEDAAQHKALSAIPVQGFYRVWTREENLDLLFVVLLAFARSGAADDRGGTRGVLKGTLNKLR